MILMEVIAMRSSAQLVTPQHLARKAVIYVR